MVLRIEIKHISYRPFRCSNEYTISIFNTGRIIEAFIFEPAEPKRPLSNRDTFRLVSNEGVIINTLRDNANLGEYRFCGEVGVPVNDSLAQFQRV